MTDLTEDNKKEMARLAEYFPFRIVWGMINKDTGEFFAYADMALRHYNMAVKAGHIVYRFVK